MGRLIYVIIKNVVDFNNVIKDIFGLHRITIYYNKMIKEI